MVSAGIDIHCNSISSHYCHPSNRSIRLQKRRAVPSTWRNCLFYVHLLALGTAWHCHCSFFSLLWCVVTLCLAITNAKMCNGEAVPSTWRNCFSFVDLLGLSTAWGGHSIIFLLFMLCCHALSFIPFLSPYPQSPFFIFITPLRCSTPIFCSSADHSSVWFEVDGHKMGLCCLSPFWFCSYRVQIFPSILQCACSNNKLITSHSDNAININCIGFVVILMFRLV